jgi:hypothetical protein
MQVNWVVNDIDDWDQPGFWYVYLNSTEVNSGIWNTSSVSWTFAPEIALYNVTVIVVDAFENRVTSMTWVWGEDTTAPTIDPTTNVVVNANTPFVLEWTCSDLSPDTYTIFQDNSILISDDWTDNEIEYSVSGLTEGEYNFTIIVFDVSGNNATNSILVTVNTVTTTATSTTSTTTSTDITEPTGTTSILPTPTDMTQTLLIIFAVAGIAISSIVVVKVLKRPK